MAIMEQFGNYLYASDLQFVLKPVRCAAVSMETVNYYTCRNTDVCSCLLDPTCAFDKVHHGKMFKLLIHRKLHKLVARLCFIVTISNVFVYLGNLAGLHISISRMALNKEM